MKMNRRVFIFTSLLIAISQKPAFAERTGGLLRPPGALAEKEFLARCNRCQRCVQVCPTRVILPASIEFGIVKMNTPIISFKKSYCNSCLKCSQICPTGALQPVTKETLNIGIAAIVEKNCVAWDWLGCTVCVEKCPLDAIHLDEHKRPVVILEKCNGCGICHVECPSTSLGRGIKGKGIVIVPQGDGGAG